jgi:hypothetical protein
MKAALKLTALAAALAAGVIATMPVSVAQPQDAGTAVATEQRPVTAFSAIELAGPYHVVIDAQATPSLALSGARKQLAEVETVVRGDTLVVRPVQRNGLFFTFGKRHETVTIRIGAAALKRLTVAGSGDVEIARIKSERFTLAGNGPGDVHASGTVRQLSVTGSGSGDLDLHDLKAADVDVALNGPGDMRLSDVAGTLAVQQAGSGDLEADGLRTTRVTARMHGPGDITLSGSAGDLNVEISGSGNFDAGGLKTVRATVRNHGPGDVTLAGVTDTLDAELQGSGGLTANLSARRLLLRMNGPGDARIDGTVAQVDAQIAGSGSLEGRGLVAGHADIAVHGPGTAAVHVTGADARATNRAQLLLVDRSGSHPAR